MAAGQAVVINGRVGDDARTAGMVLKVSSGAVVLGDFLGAGMSVETEAGSSVGGTVIATGFQALIGGSVGENVIASVGGLELQGRVGGSVEAEVGPEGPAPTYLSFIPSPVALPVVQPGFTMSESASIGGDLEYVSDLEIEIAESAVEGSVTHSQPSAAEGAEATAGSRLFGLLRRLVTLLAVGLLLFWIAPGWVPELSQTLRERPWPTMGWGIVILFLLPVALLLFVGVAAAVAMILGFLTLGGLVGLVVLLTFATVALVSLDFWLVAIFLAQIVVGFLLGTMVLERASSGQAGGKALPLFVGLLLLLLLGLPPYLGGLVRFVVVLIGLGVVGIWVAGKLRIAQTPALSG